MKRPRLTFLFMKLRMLNVYPNGFMDYEYSYDSDRHYGNYNKWVNIYNPWSTTWAQGQT